MNYTTESKSSDYLDEKHRIELSHWKKVTDKDRKWLGISASGERINDTHAAPLYTKYPFRALRRFHYMVAALFLFIFFTPIGAKWVNCSISWHHLYVPWHFLDFMLLWVSNAAQVYIKNNARLELDLNTARKDQYQLPVVKDPHGKFDRFFLDNTLASETGYSIECECSGL